jgi:N6-adenosine-specific RNA methylase IME4
MPSLASMPRRHFQVVLADPPWRFATRSDKGRSRCPDGRRFEGAEANHYETMGTDALCALPVGDLAAPDCCLFLWATWPMLQDALRVMAAWGFAYKTGGFNWMKVTSAGEPAFGNGYWTRSSSEPCLFGTRGRPRRLHADVRQGIIEPRREHSRKPDCVHDRIERLVAGPYLELFARRRRPGWSSWGDQVDQYTP